MPYISYIRQYILEHQIKYRGIFTKPVQVMAHLFFTNGGGQCIVDGNYQHVVEFGRCIPFHDYYKGVLTLNGMRDYYMRHNREAEMQSNFNSAIGMRKRLAEFKKKISDAAASDADDDIEGTVWAEIISEFNTEMEALTDFDEWAVLDKEWWLAQIREVQAIYQEEYETMPAKWALNLSQNYIPAAKGTFSSGLDRVTTDMGMYAVFRAVTEAFIQHYEEVLAANEDWLSKPVYPRDSIDFTVRKLYEKDLGLLRTLAIWKE